MDNTKRTATVIFAAIPQLATAIENVTNFCVFYKTLMLQSS